MKKRDSATFVPIAMMFTTIGITVCDSNKILGYTLMGTSLIVLTVFLIKSLKNKIKETE